MTAIACLIATWRDGELLAEAVASAAPHVDTVIVLDGGYYRVVKTYESRSSEQDLQAAADAGAKVFPRSAGFKFGFTWPDEIAKRNELLDLGRQALPNVPAGERWALVLDADEVLVGGRHLRDVTEASTRYAIPIPRVEPDGRAWAAPSRLFLLTEGVRYAGRSYWLEDPELGRVDLSHRELGPFSDVEAAVYIDHRWDRRPPWRQEVQRRYGRLLAERDHGTDG